LQKSLGARRSRAVGTAKTKSARLGQAVGRNGNTDAATRTAGTTLAGGCVFRVVEFGPGVSPRDHRTDSIDFAVVMKGEFDMELDDSVVHLKAGDVLVQRGTIHNWGSTRAPSRARSHSSWSTPSRSRWAERR
jgi:quercetin dioxygenase-like cupin family protein